MIRLQYLVIISALLYLRYTRGFPHNLLQNGIEVVTYGEPCYTPQYLPVKIEKPVQVEPQFPSTATGEGNFACISHQPLKLNYQAVSYEQEPIINEQPKEYPISVDVPPVPACTSKETLVETPDFLRGKSYTYDIQIPTQIESVPIKSVPATYNFDLQVPPSPLFPATGGSSTNCEEPITFLTGLTSRIDRVLVPACENPLSGCSCKE